MNNAFIRKLLGGTEYAPLLTKFSFFHVILYVLLFVPEILIVHLLGLYNGLIGIIFSILFIFLNIVLSPLTSMFILTMFENDKKQLFNSLVDDVLVGKKVPLDATPFDIRNWSKISKLISLLKYIRIEQLPKEKLTPLKDVFRTLENIQDADELELYWDEVVRPLLDSYKQLIEKQRKLKAESLKETRNRYLKRIMEE